MKVRKLKKGVVISLYIVLTICFCISLYYVEKGFKSDDEDIKYVNNIVFDKETPVSKVSKTINRPYTSSDIEILSSYYDINSDETSQQNSIIYYNGTYMQNTGVIYGQDTEFDIVAIMDGEVIKVEESPILGKIVEIKHLNDVISVYQLLSDVNVKIGDNIKQGDKIGISGQSNIINSNKHKLYFELIVRGMFVNGEQCYDKTLEEI